jgi:hypothetical protein
MRSRLYGHSLVLVIVLQLSWLLLTLNTPLIAPLVFDSCDSSSQLKLADGAVTHPALRILRKCENLICVQAGVCRLQRLMGKPTSSR